MTFWRSAAQEQPSAAPSSERVALAEAIREKNGADERLASLRKAHQTAESAVFRLRAEVEVAEVALEQAKAAAAEHMVALASGSAGEAPISIRSARAALLDVQDDLAAAQAARESLKGQLDDASQRPNSVANRVRAAALAVIRMEGKAAAEALVAEVERLQQQLIRRGEALRWLAREVGTFPLAERPEVPYGVLRNGVVHDTFVDPRVETVLHRIENLSRGWSNLGPDQQLGRALWSDTVAALMADASAPLPAA